MKELILGAMMASLLTLYIEDTNAGGVLSRPRQSQGPKISTIETEVEQSEDETEVESVKSDDNSKKGKKDKKNKKGKKDKKNKEGKKKKK